MNGTLSSLLANTRSLLILLPTNPHFDQVAAGLSLYLAIRNHREQNIDISISSPSPMLVEFNRLVGVDRITSEIGNKNLIIRFEGYPVDNLDKVSYEIERNEIKIKVEPKPGMAAPKKEQIMPSYAGVAADTVFLIGGAHEGHYPALSQHKELVSARVAHIGIKDLALQAPVELLSLSRPASSISEIVAGILKESGIDIDGDVATNLLMGIEEGSKNFNTSEVTADTFAVVSELMKLGGKRWVKAERPDRRHFPPGAIPGQPIIPMESRPPMASRPMQPRPVQSQQGQSQGQAQSSDPVPSSWLQPKIYKGSGTSVS